MTTEVTNQKKKEAIIDDVVNILKCNDFNVTLKVMKKPGPVQIIIPVTRELLNNAFELAKQLETEKDGQ